MYYEELNKELMKNFPYVFDNFKTISGDREIFNVGRFVETTEKFIPSRHKQFEDMLEYYSRLYKLIENNQDLIKLAML